MTDRETIDALAFHLMRTQDERDALRDEIEELRVKNVMLRRQVEAARWNEEFLEWSSR